MTRPNSASRALTVAVLGLQGAAREHRQMVASLGHEAVDVRRPAQLEGADALILPGGESTTMSMLLESSGLFDPIAEFVASGAPVFGTCAGMILLADQVLDGRPDQRSFGALRLSVKRNGFGRQTASFEADLDVKGLDSPFRAVFIRAPLVTEVGSDVDVLATVTGDDGAQYPALCRKGPIMVSAFHPELTDDARLHELWLASV
ncbi:MAG: pyridoxal 5'-phosphate synthase glutaminase subunit PdxT [Acidimicrobiales bacterium]